MKKRIKIVLFLLAIVFISGCTKRNYNLENAQIYTTVYPVKFITEYLYSADSQVDSIYPNGVDIDTYKLTKKQLDTYAEGDLFVYVGLGNEKNIAKSLINRNKNLLLIDATYGLDSDDEEKMWLAPNNFLMLVKNIKNSLNEYLDNTLKIDEVNKNYDDLYEKVSWIDAELRSLAKEAKSNNSSTIVIANNTLKFLSGYGFDVISLEDIELSNSENALKDIKNKFKNSTYTNIFKLKSSTDSDFIKELVEKNNAKTIIINDLITNDDPTSDYISIQYENLSLIRDAVLK